ncbi:exodeoxyribonuclease V subunit gamma [Rhodococcus rhodnii]|uniref:RecBCD enzyme subunit RecC n=2 Tax=Rhodococcus rhodnii TaxID=38312 RepID=R7WQJ1_9NOCA|nr:exodeoxyribonuclease V subunit gamma [Rhodococcus rhodnii]EOM77573.1 exodeoxyribonuclease V gamma subunit [Rhodococcus rhodnii LMG 5362]TXG89211.1 exodeoxyribonuclease V subunit gamma [Rhodococcus rhodnii]
MLRLHRALRADALATGLAEVLAAPLPDPFAPEVVAVPAKGVERWLSQVLATESGGASRDGVAANIAFPHPSRLVRDVLAQATGRDPERDPWSQERLVWTVLSVVDDAEGLPWARVLDRHLGRGDTGPSGSDRSGRRLATAAHLADLLRSYGASRPAMLADWGRGGVSDGAGGTVPDDLRWQIEVYRGVRDRVGGAPAETLDEDCRRIRDDPDAIDLPARLSLFGPTRLTTEELTVLAALADRRDVHVWLPHPSPAMWERLREYSIPENRAADRSALAVAHPLLADLARDVRELEFRARTTGGESDTVGPGEPAGTSLLARLQADIANDREPERSASAADGSFEVHACHGAPRQVEVLREVLLHAFEDDPDLEPRDVVVMCPDVETYAPLVRAAFGQLDPGGAGDAHPGHRLRVRMADRSLRQTNPILAVVARVLDLASGRVTATELLDLAAAGPVRTRFGWDDDELERLRDWVTASGARWGIDAAQRSDYGLGSFAQNTIGVGLDRILLGVCADASDGWLDLVAPLDDVDSSDIDLAGRFAEFVDRLSRVLGSLRGDAPVAAWVQALTSAIDLLTATVPADAWQIALARRELAAATEHGEAATVGLADVRSLLARTLAGRPTRANFRTGELTVCTMVPMRSVPHRVVILLGLDDDVFPRTLDVDGDDVLARNPLAGERDPRSEDRQLLLDAVMSATERLVVLYTGFDPVTGTRKPPAVPVGGLIDVAVAMTGEDDRTRVVREHPLQPFDARNFRRIEGVRERPFSFDTVALAGARAAAAPQRARRELAHVDLGPAEPGDVDLADLVAFAQHPVQGFVRQRLGVRVPEDDDEIVDSLDTTLDPLAKWDLGERMLASRIAGHDAAEFRASEWRRGTLPPFALGAHGLAEVEYTVDRLADACRPLYAAPATVVDVAIDLGGGRTLTGTVTGLHDGVLVRSSFSRLAPKHRIAAWIQLLAAACVSSTTRAVCTGRGRGSRPTWRSTFTAPDDPHAILRSLVALRDSGLARPLPAGPTASAAYAERRARGEGEDEALAAASARWADRFGDATDRTIEYVYGPQSPFEEIASARTDHATESTLFGATACILWGGLFAHETEGQP